MGMGMNHWEWKGMGLKKTFPPISSLHRSSALDWGDLSQQAPADIMWHMAPSSRSLSKLPRRAP